MSATEELRRLLDERGVEHSDFASAYRLSTRWQDSSKRVIEHQLRKDADIGDMGIVRNLTPEQAIAATVGSELPYDELLRWLENDWHISASWDGLRKLWCIELTEEGVKLRNSAHVTLGNEESYTRDDVESAFVSGYSLGCLPVGSDPRWDQNEQTVDEHMAELGWVRAELLPDMRARVVE